MNNGDMPAMPITNSDLAADINEHGSSKFGGMTKRELIAMHAMQGLLCGRRSDTLYDPKLLAEKSTSYTDALLKELEK